MKITLAKTAGFCFGVANAVNMVYQTIENAEGPVYTYGPIIHNENVVNDLRSRGVGVIESEEELEKLEKGTVIIRSHGVSKRIFTLLDRPGITVIDATCPFVKKIHDMVEKAGSEGRTVILAGNREHPEVQGTVGWAKGPCFVVDSPEELKGLDIPDDAQVFLAAQTTYNYEKFKELVEISKKMNYDVWCGHTVCNATRERQEEASRIAQMVDAMIVIGDRHSSNTRKLYEICKRKCISTYFIEEPDDLKLQLFESFYHVGITAGASTPKKLIEEVHEYVRNES